MIMEKLFRGNKKVIGNIRILVLMLLVAVAVYQLTAQDICSDFTNTTLDKKDKFGFFYECRYYNTTELKTIEIIEKANNPYNLYNYTENYIN